MRTLEEALAVGAAALRRVPAVQPKRLLTAVRIQEFWPRNWLYLSSILNAFV